MLYREGQGGNVNIWHCIAYRESKWNPYATGSAGERGIFQIHPVHASWIGSDWWRLYEPAVNTHYAVELYRRAGYSFSPWRSTVAPCY